MTNPATDKIKGLKCKECGKYFPPKAIHVCDECFGPLEVDYNYDLLKGRVTRASIQAGPPTLWRYWDLLPVETRNPVTIHEGLTPLFHAKRLGAELGLDKLYVKNDSVNPTYSFKDRVVSVALTRAKELGFDTVACASTGNLAGAVAAYGKVGGFKTCVFIPSDLEAGKITGAGVYDPVLFGVNGSYDDVNRLCSEIADVYKWAFVNVNVRPYYAEGSKTLGFETAEQLGWQAPDHCVVPVASGSLLTKIHKGLREFMALGLIPEKPFKMSAAQAEGCSPVVKAIQTGGEVVPVRPKTIAKSLAIGNPADGYYASKLVRETGGGADSVTDEEVVEGIKLLARTEGLFTETAGGVTIGVLKKLALGGKIKRGEVVVAYITGSGYKTLEAVTGKTARVNLIAPRLDEFRALYDRVSAEKVPAAAG